MADPFDGTDEMHRRSEWMTAADVNILEFLHAARDARGNPSEQSPQTISWNTGHSRKWIGDRLREELEERDLVEKEDRGRYRLSERGEKLMTGDIRPEDA